MKKGRGQRRWNQGLTSNCLSPRVTPSVDLTRLLLLLFSSPLLFSWWRLKFDSATARGPKTARRTRAARIELGTFDEVDDADRVEFPARFYELFLSVLALARDARLLTPVCKLHIKPTLNPTTIGGLRCFPVSEWPRQQSAVNSDLPVMMAVSFVDICSLLDGAGDEGSLHCGWSLYLSRGVSWVRVGRRPRPYHRQLISKKFA